MASSKKSAVYKKNPKSPRSKTRMSAQSAKPKVSFGSVTTYHFDRAQGFSSIPTNGGYPLGMERKHYAKEELPLEVHQAEKQKNRETYEKLDDLNGSDNYVCPYTRRMYQPNRSDNVTYFDESDRLCLLIDSGAKIDHFQSNECCEISLSRENIGCNCVNWCLAGTCPCWTADICCYSEGNRRSCTCTKDGCKNPAGRMKLNMDKVLEHYINTKKRLAETESKVAILKDSGKRNKDYDTLAVDRLLARSKKKNHAEKKDKSQQLIKK